MEETTCAGFTIPETTSNAAVFPEAIFPRLEPEVVVYLMLAAGGYSEASPGLIAAGMAAVAEIDREG